MSKAITGDARIPPFCAAASLVGAGAAAIITSVHNQKESHIPAVCVGSSLIGIGALTAAIVHHESPFGWHVPNKPAVLGLLAGLGALGYTYNWHQKSEHNRTKLPPIHCALGSVGIAGLIAATALFFSPRHHI
jgi:uncharacterized membrane protein YebE (DUF533 family)